MSRRVAAAVFAVTAFALAWPSAARAQEAASRPLVIPDSVVGVAAPAAEPDAPPAPVARRGRSKVMWGMYGFTIATQAADVHSTFAALDAGAVEANPLLKSMASNRGAFVAAKAGVTAALLYAGSRTARRHKAVAVATLAGVGAAYAAIAARNYRVAREAAGR